LGLVAAGVGITVLTENVCRSLPQGTKLIPISDVQTPFETVAVWKTNKMDNAKRKFIDGLRSLVIARSISNEQAPLLHSTRKISG
jgi:DNA-binding transcriptional LysR family regulator